MIHILEIEHRASRIPSDLAEGKAFYWPSEFAVPGIKQRIKDAISVLRGHTHAVSFIDAVRFESEPAGRAFGRGRNATSL